MTTEMFDVRMEVTLDYHTVVNATCKRQAIGLAKDQIEQDGLIILHCDHEHAEATKD